ncbi:hypothetical protein Ahy_B05g079165 isoform B [Arachis hypogaea]|uniref:Uncharacterized protein n=1 Tax=Arachis hypogaea TaxID=3818 RepID=A0A444Z929_ARAHY|nr:hypothetical protein Ahy_B05g079165 isoform B [Arachis hypogaea]
MYGNSHARTQIQKSIGVMIRQPLILDITHDLNPDATSCKAVDTATSSKPRLQGWWLSRMTPLSEGQVARGVCVGFSTARAMPAIRA